MQSFYKYYSGEKAAPVLTIVVGGNHEASNHMWELYYGGWLVERNILQFPDMMLAIFALAFAGQGAGHREQVAAGAAHT